MSRATCGEHWGLMNFGIVDFPLASGLAVDVCDLDHWVDPLGQIDLHHTYPDNSGRVLQVEETWYN